MSDPEGEKRQSVIAHNEQFAKDHGYAVPTVNSVKEFDRRASLELPTSEDVHEARQFLNIMMNIVAIAELKGWEEKYLKWYKELQHKFENLMLKRKRTPLPTKARVYEEHGFFPDMDEWPKKPEK